MKTFRSDPVMEKLTAQLEALLKRQLGEYQQILDLLGRKRVAIREAKPEVVSDLCVLENEKLQTVSELEKQRLALMAELTLKVNARANEPLRLQLLAEALGEPARSQLLALRIGLKQAITKVQHEAAVSRLATQSVLRHMTGMVQSIGAATTGVETYGQRGQRPRSATAVSTFSAVA
jgi:hypothetical protein